VTRALEAGAGIIFAKRAMDKRRHHLDGLRWTRCLTLASAPSPRCTTLRRIVANRLLDQSQHGSEGPGGRAGQGQGIFCTGDAVGGPGMGRERIHRCPVPETS